MDTLAQVSEIAGYILPILGVIVLIAVLILVITLISVVKDVNKATNTVNGYLTDLNVTVKAVNNLAMSVEACRIAATRIVKKSINEIGTKYETIKLTVEKLLESWFTKAEEKKEENEVKDKKEEEIPTEVK